MAKIYLVRHCESEGNACRRTQAHVDALVTHKGYEQCEMLRRRFEGIHIDKLYSSDSYRSIMTIDPIAKERGLTIHTRISLREVTTGIWEDMAWGNIADEFPEENRAWSETPWALKTPGASSFEQVAARLICGLKRIAREVGPDGVAVAVSHSCTIKATLCTILGEPMTRVKEFGHGDNTSVSLLNVDGDGNITVEFMNDESHLPDRLKRAWGGIAGADINMAVYPVRPEQEETLLDLAQAEAAEHRGDDRAAGLAGVVVGGANADEHDDEQEEHHDRAGVHDDLRDTQEGGAVRNVQDCQAEHDADHADDRVCGLLTEEDTQSAGHHHDGRACEEDDLPR